MSLLPILTASSLTVGFNLYRYGKTIKKNVLIVRGCLQDVHLYLLFWFSICTNNYLRFLFTKLQPQYNKIVFFYQAFGSETASCSCFIMFHAPWLSQNLGQSSNWGQDYWWWKWGPNYTLQALNYQTWFIEEYSISTFYIFWMVLITSAIKL